jgi:aldose 1-epimerase
MSGGQPAQRRPRAGEPFGELEDGRIVRTLALGAASGLEVHVLDLGATVHRLELTGGDGVRRNVTLGHPTVADYRNGTAFLGATIGRYANRIAGGRFQLDGREVRVGVSDRGNHLHGGPDGFDRRVWTVIEHDAQHAVLTLHSPDGDQGFPGALDVRATYRVDGSTLELLLEAVADARTVVNLTSHLYLNLDGEGAGTIDGHVLQVLGDTYLPVDATGIPVRAAAPVEGTPFDLREPRVLGPVLRTDHPQLRDTQGIDHDFALRGTGLRPVARLVSPRTRTAMELLTDQPHLQVYTGGYFDGTTRSSWGGLHRQGDGLALEPQLPPDSPNRPDGPSPVLAAGATYRSTIRWNFSALARESWASNPT